MTPDIPQEVMALARKVIDDIPAIDRDGDFALKISIAAIMEVTERAAAVAETIVGDRGGVPERIRIATAIRNWEYTKNG